MKQKDFDIQKWNDSKTKHKDMCGSYDFCCVCDKKVKNPCEKAYSKYSKMNKIRKAKARANFKINGQELLFRSTVIDENK